MKNKSTKNWVSKFLFIFFIRMQTRRNSKISTQKMESIRVVVKNPKEASNVVELFGNNLTTKQIPFGTGMLQQDSKRLLIKFS
jgi:hypothetical protein